MSNQISNTSFDVDMGRQIQSSANSPRTSREISQNALSSANSAETLLSLDEKLIEINRSLTEGGYPYSVSIDAETGRVIMSIISRDGLQVITQIPSETSLRLAKNLPSNIGNFIDRFL